MPGELIPIILFISIAAVAIFRPLTTRIGKVIEQSHHEKKARPDPQITRLMQIMERLVDRLDRLEDRVDFTERMLERQQRQAQLGEGPARRDPEKHGRESRVSRRDDPSTF
jgi:hypothetical protein